MVFQRNSPTTVEIKATAFRDDGSAELVRVVELAFDELTFWSQACFVRGEHLRVHICGQGWFEVAVAESSSKKTRAVFATVCQV
jgi:hypothetical protein